MKKVIESKTGKQLVVNMDYQATVHDLLESKQYDEVIQLMDKALDEEQTSTYYYYRAYARNEIPHGWDKNFKLILDDLNQAIAIDNDEDSLYLRFEVLHQYLQNQHSLLYSLEDDQHNVKSINENGDIEYYTETEPLSWNDNESDEINKYEALKDESLDKLIELYPKARYYCIKSDRHTQDRLQNIEKACELDPQSWYFERKVDIEIEEGLYERALNSIVQVKELNHGQIDSDLTYKHARLLIILGDYNTAESVVKELVPIKAEKGLYPERPVLLTKGHTWMQGYYGIELFFLAGKVEEYARLLSEFYKENPEWVSLELIHRLFKDENYHMFLKYFNYKDYKTQSILFMNICAHLGNKEIDAAKELIKYLNGERLYHECININLTPISQEEDVRNSRVLRFEQPSYGTYDDIDILFSLIRFDRLGVNLFIDIVVSLFYEHNHDIYKIYENCLIGFDQNSMSSKNYPITDESQTGQTNITRRMKIMQAFLHELPYLRSKDPAKVLILQNRFELALSMHIFLESDKIENNARETERKRILSNLSHSIKNMLRSVIDPLINLREELPEKASVIDNALKGANLIREIVNSINLSFKTSLDDLLWDIKNPGKESVALQEMIISSLQYSIGNMFDFRYFPAYAENYYPRSMKKQEFEAVQEEWKSVSTTTSLNALQNFANKNLFILSVELSDSAQYRIGNEKSSAIKLMILFQEIIFNAVKYASYVPFTDRFIEINLSEHDDKLKLEIKNSYRPEVRARTTGVGKLVIENFAKVLDCTPEITTDDNVYNITMDFHNIWRNNA